MFALDPHQMLINFLYGAPVFLFSLVFHEYAHALMAYRLGDRTAAYEGRLTLDPTVHIDPLGTLLMPALGLMFGGFIFGWAKPVPFNPNHLRNAGRDTMWIALAGPLSNLLLLIFFAAAMRVLTPMADSMSPVLFKTLGELLWWGIWINAILAVFNMIPLPPLDGSKVLAFFVDHSTAYKIMTFNPTYSLVIILVLVGAGVLSWPLARLVDLAQFIRTAGM